MKRSPLDQFLIRHKKHIFAGIGLLFLCIVFFFVQIQTSLYKSSIMEDLEKRTHAPFDGFAFPIQETLNWTKLTSTEYAQFKDGSLTYQNAPKEKILSIPAYDASVLKNDPKLLTWSGKDLDTRNTLLTYSTAYLGAYTGGSSPAIEGAGSHPAVDIRAPKGTPIYAIANGIVIKTTSDPASGNGLSAVIMHKGVPSFDNPEEKVKYYSVYLHMDVLSVSPGQEVRKGQQIGTVGTTGISTTYHLHFQIDTEAAPFHPYWPFSWQDAKTANLDFFTGVNQGLGKENARQYTIHPYAYLNKYARYVSPTTSTSTASTEVTLPTGTTAGDTSSLTTPTTEIKETITTPDLKPVAEKISFVPKSTETIIAGQPLTISLYALSESGTVKTDYAPERAIGVTHTGGGTLSANSISTFKEGKAEIRYTSNDPEEVTLSFATESGVYTHKIFVIDRLSPVTSFSLEVSPLPLEVDKPATLTITTLGSDGNKTLSGLYQPASLSVEGGSATLQKNTLLGDAFDNGVTTVTITPKTEGLLTFIVQEGAAIGKRSYTVDKASSTPTNTTTASTQLFNDVPKSHPHFKAITYLKKKGIIDGYADGTFRPDQGVNRAEATKILLAASGVQPKTGVKQSSFPDVDKNAWFAVWVERGKELGILAGNPDGTFHPTSPVTGAANLKIALRTNKILTEKLYKTDLSQSPFSDVPRDSWFSKDYQYAKEKNLVSSDRSGNAGAGKNLTRGEVAELMYRIMVMKEARASAYSDDLVVN